MARAKTPPQPIIVTAETNVEAVTIALQETPEGETPTTQQPPLYLEDALVNLTNSFAEMAEVIKALPPVLELDENGEFLVDQNTGERHLVVPDEWQASLDPASVPDEGFVNWLLKKIQWRRALAGSAQIELEAIANKIGKMEEDALAALRAKPEYMVLADQRARAADIFERATKDRTSIEQWSHSMLKRFAQRVLAGKKTQTWNSIYGALSLRKGPPTIKVLTMMRRLLSTKR